MRPRPRPGDGPPVGRPGWDPRDGLDGLRSGPLLRWLGVLSTRNAVLVLVAVTLLGIAATLIGGREPGFLLGFFVTVGSIAAVLGVRRGAVYLMFPLPALALFVAAVITGKVHDSSLTSSTAGLGVGFLQWVAHVFLPMVIATIAALVVGGIRWALDHQLVIGQFPAAGGRRNASPAPRPAPRAGRPGGAASWTSRAAADLRARRPGADPARAARAARPARPDRPSGDQPADRDRWGDPRRPPAAGPRPRDSARAATRDGARDDASNGRPATPGRAPGGEPRARAPRPAVRPPWDARPRPAGQPPRPSGPPSPRDQSTRD